MDDIEGLLNRNRIWLDRNVGVGVIPPGLALAVGVTGPVLRGSGISHDVRRARPYDAYAELDFDVPVRTAGDAEARFEVRIAEIVQSARLVRQILDGLTEGPVFGRKPLKNPKATRVKEGEIYAAVESPRGELGYYLISDGSNKERFPQFFGKKKSNEGAFVKCFRTGIFKPVTQRRNFKLNDVYTVI